MQTECSKSLSNPLKSVSIHYKQFSCTFLAVPLEEDIEEVCSYLLQLIDGRNLEQVSSVLKFLSRYPDSLELVFMGAGRL